MKSKVEVRVKKKIGGEDRYRLVTGGEEEGPNGLRVAYRDFENPGPWTTQKTYPRCRGVNLTRRNRRPRPCPDYTEKDRVGLSPEPWSVVDTNSGHSTMDPRLPVDGLAPRGNGDGPTVAEAPGARRCVSTPTTPCRDPSVPCPTTGTRDTPTEVCRDPPLR